MDKEKLLYDLFQSYYDARKNKRNTQNQVEFEFNLESNLIKLYDELVDWTYEVWKSIYFIQNYPVKREIFAWDFRDRIIHHLIYNYILPIFEKEFIYDSYSCRKWKWTSFWIKRLQKFVRSCSANFTEDCYILKLDISWYFMSINKNILFEKINNILDSKISPFSKGERPKEVLLGYTYNEVKWEGLKLTYHNFTINLIKKIIFNDCTKNSIFKWKKENYIWLPKNKSLFFAKQNCGLPIWNLTSQLFSNIYLKDFDKYIKNELGIKYYGRYVDDFFVIHKNKDYLLWLIPKINDYLQSNLELTLHPKKIHLQHYKKWVLFLWVFIKPYRTYIRKRTIWYFYWKIEQLNKVLKDNNYEMTNSLANDFLSCVNSYLWLLKHHKSYKIRKKVLENNVDNNFWEYFYIFGDYIVVKRKKIFLESFKKD
jgi:RNA-directed DNA polymerase